MDIKSAKITFRNTPRPGDGKIVRRIMKSTGFFEAVFDELDSAEANAEAIAGNPKSEEKLLFIEVGGVEEGFAIFGRESCCDATVYMSWLCVNNSLRGMGLGKRLMAEVLRQSWENKARKLILQTSGRPQYEPTRAFYQKLGFSKEAEIADYYTDGESTFFYTIYNPQYLAKKLKK